LLGDHLFRYYVQSPVKCVDLAEFARVGAPFCEPLQEAINVDPESMPIRAGHQFTKAGLAIDDRDGKVYGVEISDKRRWAQVSIMQKIRDGLPSTMNALSSINGRQSHLDVIDKITNDKMGLKSWIYERGIWKCLCTFSGELDQNQS
jgi:hypothetical protein